MKGIAMESLASGMPGVSPRNIAEMRHRSQSSAEEKANSLSHGVGFLLALAAAPVLLVATARQGNALNLVGASVFAATMVLLYLSSAIQHALAPGRAKRLCGKIDHGAIYLFIAGSWPAVKKVEEVAAGDPDGINSILRYSWQGKLPYRMVFQVRATHIEWLVAIEGTAEGDLEGIGRWHFSRQEGASVVRYEWYVRSTRWWMNLIAPFARAMFIRNHGVIMRQGAEKLAARLGATLVSQEYIDLMKQAAPQMG